MSEELIYTDDEGRDHLLGEPKLINITSTEWWMLKEMMYYQKCDVHVCGFSHSFEYQITTPGGDRYEVNEWSEYVLKVKKLKAGEDWGK
jgi:hypothetical protein